jgi:hypothetical protein
VHDYAAGKADWGSFGLPLEGAEGSETRVGGYLRTDVPNCRLDDRLQEVCARLDESGWDTCFVLNDEGVVLGRIGRRAIRGRADITAEEAMTPGPSTIRPSARLEANGRTNETAEPDEPTGDHIRRPPRGALDPPRRRGSPSKARRLAPMHARGPV